MMVIEPAADAAKSAIDALKSAPVVLALVLLQAGVLGMLGWYSHERTKSNDRLIELYHKQFEQLVARCASSKLEPNKDVRYGLQSSESHPYFLPPKDELLKETGPP